MSGNCQMILILLICIVAVISAFGIALLYFYNKHKKILENLTEYEIDVNATIDAEIPKILEQFVQFVFDDYRVKNLEFKELHHIDTAEEQKITKEVAALCAERISPAMIHKLSLFWNPQSIGSVIADKVYLIVVAYCAKNNAVHNGENA